MVYVCCNRHAHCIVTSEILNQLLGMFDIESVLLHTQVINTKEMGALIHIITLYAFVITVCTVILHTWIPSLTLTCVIV